MENGLLRGERRGRKAPQDSTFLLQLVRALAVHTDGESPQRTSDGILAIGRKYRLTAYDAVYLELAVRENAPLASFNSAMLKAAGSMGVRIFENDF